MADFLSHRFRERAADYGSILSKYEDQAAVNRTRTYSYAIAQEHFLLHAEVGAAVSEEHVHLFEAAFVKQFVDTLTSRVAAFGVVFFYGCSTTACHSLLTLLDELLKFF